MDVERLHPDTVLHQVDDRLFGLRVVDEREHPDELWQHVESPALVALEEHLGVGVIGASAADRRTRRARRAARGGCRSRR